MSIPLTPSHNAVYPSENPTALQSHVAFWDRDNDGVIWPTDTYAGFRALGFNVVSAFLSAVIIHSSLSYPSGSTLYPDPTFRIRIAGIHKAKHGSDSDVYSRKGVFIEANFEEIFTTYADPPYDSLTFKQAIALVKGNADPYDLFGWSANFFEWGSLYIMLAPEDGRMKKEDLLGLFDGSLFYKVADKVERKRALEREKSKLPLNSIAQTDDASKPKVE